MGYETLHFLSVYDKTGAILDSEPYENEITIQFQTSFDDSIKWYESEKDLITFSKKYPDIIFQLLGYGEEALDVWVRYFLNGYLIFFEHIKKPDWSFETLIENGVDLNV